MKILKTKFNKTKIVKIGLGTVMIIAVFLAGMGFDSLLSKIPHGVDFKPSPSQNNAAVVSTQKEVVQGKINAVDSTHISVTTSDGSIKDLLFINKSVLLSNTSKPIAISDIKQGNNVLIYASQNSDGKLEVERLRLME